MTCKDCVHYAVCKFVEPYHLDVKCNHFKNKADFVEVKHGEWEMVDVEGYWVQHIEESLKTRKPTKTKLPVCSCCKKRFGTAVLGYSYCPNCGADMRKEGADNG